MSKPMATHKAIEKKPLQRKHTLEDDVAGKTLRPPTFELTAEASEAKPAQLQEAPQKADAPVQEPEKELSEADRLRSTVAETAEKWNGEEFISKQEILDIRERTGLKNYTTCLEFAGKMMRDSAMEVYGKDWKMAAETARAFSNTKVDWEKAVGARLQAGGYGKAVALLQKAIDRVEKQKTETLEDIEKLRRPREEGEKELAYKQRLIRADAIEKFAIKALDRALRQVTGQRDKWQGKVNRSLEKADNLDAGNTAMIKAADGMTNGRPKPGEFIILAQAPGGAKYGVSESTKVFLAGGTFKHIATFMEVLQEDDGSGYELWRTIDGGGTEGKETLLRIRLSDRMVFPGAKGVKLPDAGSASGSQLAGWMDMDEIVKKRDEKMAAGKK